MTRLLAFLLLALVPANSAAAASGPANPYMGPTGTSAMHGDAYASDTTPLHGPGTDALDSRYVPLAGACPSILIGSDNLPVALCTEIADRAPQAYVLNPDTGFPLATLKLTKGGLFSGVYPYLDRRNRIVFADGSGDLLRIAHVQAADGSWSLKVVRRTPLPAISGVVGLSPDWRGRTWFAAENGTVGFVRTDGAVRSLTLGKDEHVANSIATSPDGTAVATDQALYLLRAKAGGEPRVVWRAPYDRGPARKPGQLSRGTGSTPTFFGPKSGYEYLTIVDNAVPAEHLRVFGTKRGRIVCDTPVLLPGPSGSENSPIGAGRAVIVASTYGYPYPATPDDAGPAVPATADLGGGVTRIDVKRSGCTTRWTSPIRSAAVPKLSLADGLVYTTTREPPRGAASSVLDRFDAVTLDVNTGAERSRHTLGATTAFDTLQLAGNVGPGSVLWQGTLTGLLRISPQRPRR